MEDKTKMNERAQLPLLAFNDSGVNATTKQDKRHRTQFRFWLDTNKADEREMGLKLDAMKDDKSKSFAQFMRDAIRLMLALIAGDLSILAELFPSVVDNIRSQAIADYQQQQASREFEIMINALATRIENKLETVSISAQSAHKGHSIVNMPQQGGLQTLGGLQTVTNGLKPMTAPPLNDDIADDDLGLVVTQAKGDGKAVTNFLNSMMALQTKDKTQ